MDAVTLKEYQKRMRVQRQIADAFNDKPEAKQAFLDMASHRVKLELYAEGYNVRPNPR